MLNAAGRCAPWSWSTPATGRSRSARTITSPRPTRPWSSTGTPRGGTGWTSPRGPRSGSSPASNARSTWSRWPGRRSCRACGWAAGGWTTTGSTARSSTRAPARRTRWLSSAGPGTRAVRAHRRRPGAAGRHRPVHRGRAGPVRGRGRGRVRRRQGHPRVDGPGPRDPRRRRPRSGHHRRRRAGSLGHHQGRRRHPGRPDRRARQGRQPRHHGRRPPGPGHRAVHRDHGRQRPDPHGRRHRLPRAPDLPADCCPRRSAPASPPSIGGGTGPAEGTKATTVTPGAWNLARMLEAIDRLAAQRRAARQGQHGLRGSPVGAAARRGVRVQAARGLGLHAGRDRRLPARLPRRPGCRRRCTPTR